MSSDRAHHSRKYRKARNHPSRNLTHAQRLLVMGFSQRYTEACRQRDSKRIRRAIHELMEGLVRNVVLRPFMDAMVKDVLKHCTSGGYVGNTDLPYPTGGVVRG